MNYALLLRGINVGGRNTVKMSILKQMLESLQFYNVKTYIQSGNAVFDTDMEPSQMKEAIRESFVKTFGFPCDIMIRSKSDMFRVQGNLPFTRQEIEEACESNPKIEHLYVYFTEDVLDKDHLKKLTEAYSGSDKITIGEREIYLLCSQSIRDSKLAAKLKALSVPMTARNWKTVEKLCEILQS